MTELPTSFDRCQLWRTTLQEQAADQFASERGRLRTSLLSFRDRAAHLANEIRRDLPEATVHDLTHLDALWEVAATIAGDGYAVTPAEGFVLGGAILLHDLAMSVAAVEGGLEAIKQDPRWADLVFSEYREAHDRDPTTEEVRNPETRIHRRALFSLLRQVHAENAERLAFLSYPGSDGSPQFLIEDTELRQTYGRIIGRIAHSHWWSIGEAERNFSRVIGAPHWCPPDWKVDPLKVACLLRAADAAHLDARRAPGFLKAISDLSPTSEAHWRFQEKLSKPYLREDALVFTSGSAFRLCDAGAWWLCLEALRTVDRELGSVDALFADRRAPRFAARGVAGVDSPERLASFVQTDGWLPINATIHVSDLPNVITSIGGEELYGKHPEVALRELIQNACDAVRARRLYEKREAGFGQVIVSFSKSEDGAHWLRVDDTGVGMSQRVLTDFLLNFGRSFWGSSQMQEEFPGLLSSGVKPTGKYGIGFFSVFMVANQVQVITRRSDAGAKDTLVLEFSEGVQGRPILRSADRAERLIDGGTSVKLRLVKHPEERGGLLRPNHAEEPILLEDLCRRMCPAVDVDLYVRKADRIEKIVGAEDWKTVDAMTFLARLEPNYPDEQGKRDPAQIEAFRTRVSPNLRVLRDADGEIVGRACITVGLGSQWDAHGLDGAVTVGGLKACGLSGIVGILPGKSLRASRDLATPLVDDSTLARWAEEQAQILPQIWDDAETLSRCARYVRLCSGSTRGLPVAKYRGSWVSADQIAEMASPPDVAVLLDDFTIEYQLKHLESYELDDSVFVTEVRGVPALLQSRGLGPSDWPIQWHSDSDWRHSFMRATLAGVVIEALCRAWGVPVEVVASATDFNREDEVPIAHAGDRVIRARATRIVKPC